MNIYEGDISGLQVIKPKIFADERGYFFESYNKNRYEQLGIVDTFVQDNESKSKKGVLRGLHMQVGEWAQAKLVTVAVGKVWDVAVDCRPNSPTYGKHYGVELNDENKLQFYIPRGFAHGFLVLSEECVFQYKCDNYYQKSAESGYRFDSPLLNIEWPKIKVDFTVSEKDLLLPNFEG